VDAWTSVCTSVDGLYTELSGERAEVIFVHIRLQSDDRQILMPEWRTEWRFHQVEALGHVRARINWEVGHRST
jgi:hypothetical protein